LCHFKFLTMINTIVGAGAGASSGYGSGSGSDQKMRLLAAPALAPQLWIKERGNCENFSERKEEILHHNRYSMYLFVSNNQNHRDHNI
jgi:hypothetical protein